MIITAKVAPTAMSFHLWTFSGQLNLQLSYNGKHTSDVLVDSYFQRVVDMVAMLGVQEKEVGIDLD